MTIKITEIQKRVLIKSSLVLAYFFIASQVNFVFLLFLGESNWDIKKINSLNLFEHILGASSFYLITLIWILTTYAFLYLTKDLINEYFAYTLKKERKKEEEETRSEIP